MIIFEDKLASCIKSIIIGPADEKKVSAKRERVPD
jgi:hypothetical protein